MRTLECIKSFSIPRIDDEGFRTNEEKIIEKGTIWHESTESNIIGGEIHLDGKEEILPDGTISYPWVEIDEDTLKRYFIEIN